MNFQEATERLLDGLPRKAGNPKSFVFEVPMETPIVAKGDPSVQPEEYDSVLETDASFLPVDGVEGQAWRLTVNGREYKIKSKSRRHGKGPVVAEMKAVIDGMKEAAQRGARCLIVKTDNRWCAHVLVSLWKPKKDHTVPVAKQAMSLMDQFKTVAIIHTRTKNIRRVDRRARRAAEARQADVERKISERLDKLQEIIQRAASVRLERMKGGWRANGRFNVSIYPPSCACQQWSLRWKNVPLAGKRAQRLPCKHIVAAAMNVGIQDPKTLLALARKAKT